MFTYNHKDANRCMPAGVYDAELESVEEATSKKGNPMLVLTWGVMFQGNVIQLRDWIVAPTTVYKLKQLAAAVSQSDQFENDAFDISAFTGQLFGLDLVVKRSEQYGEQNQVKKYQAAGYTTADQAVGAAETADDGIPF